MELATLLKNAAEQGTANAIKEERPVPDRMTKADSYRLYGRSNVTDGSVRGLSPHNNLPTLPRFFLTDRNSKPLRLRAIGSPTCPQETGKRIRCDSGAWTVFDIEE